MCPAQAPSLNHLLASLPAAEIERMAPHLELVALPLGQVLYESGRAQSKVYFPTTAIISLHYLLEDGSSSEIAVVGHDGMLGITVLTGGETTSSSAMVTSAGHAYSMSAKLIVAEFNRAGPLLHLLLRYTQALLTQMSQTAVCNRHHSIEKQLCRWLLLRLDRMSSSSLTITQEMIASMLGVRREGVTEAASKLQHAGLISSVRGHIQVLDRPGLERKVCECYGVVKREYDRLVSDIPDGDPFHVLGDSDLAPLYVHQDARVAPEMHPS